MYQRASSVDIYSDTEGVSLGGAAIHPTALLENVRLGENVRVGAYSVLRDCEIGNNVYIAPHVVIGEEAEHSTEKFELNPRSYSGRIVIGCNTVIREYTSITRPVRETTFIGDSVYIMGHCYIAHDCQIEDHAVLSNGVILGGTTRIMRGANLGLGSVCHQGTTVGAYAMIAANATVVKDVPPLGKYIPNKSLGINVYAIRKWKLPFVGERPADIIGTSFYQSLFGEWEERRHKERAVHRFADVHER